MVSRGGIAVLGALWLLGGGNLYFKCFPDLSVVENAENTIKPRLLLTKQISWPSCAHPLDTMNEILLGNSYLKVPPAGKFTISA